MKLFDLIKDKLKDPKGVISDNEMCVLNRRDFLYSETSATLSFLKMFNADKVTYEMYSIIDFLYANLCKVSEEDEINIYQFSQTMTLPSFAVCCLIGDKAKKINIYAPRGAQKIASTDVYSSTLIEKFDHSLKSKLLPSDIGKNKLNSIDVILCNASNEAEVTSALKSFEAVKRGLIMIKGYGRKDAPNCGEMILAARLNVHCTLAGFGFCTVL